jgi:IMP dehydrogenase
MLEYITFDDVLIMPKYSTVKSRKDVDIGVNLGEYRLTIPILSANMDTVTGEDMAAAMSDAGGLGVLHRFWSIEDEAKRVRNLIGQSCTVACSVGLGDYELERAKKMIDLGASYIVIDVAHGAQQQVAEQYKKIQDYSKERAFIIVGNFATGESIMEFVAECGYAFVKDFNNHAAIKVGIGPGSACTTRIKTGVGIPQLSAIMDCAKSSVTLIADGGMKTPGDIAKAIAAGAKCVMLGGMLAGTDETPGEIVFGNHKKYRGSASKESYEDQGKDASWRTAEGESFTVPYKGPVASVLQDIEGGLRSAFTYVGATNVRDFQEKAKLIKVSTLAQRESGAHGKRD